MRPSRYNVGYQTQSLQAGSQEVAGSMFLNVSGATLNIQSIRLEGALPEGTSWIHWWDRDTYEWTEAVWCDLSDEGDGSVIGWGDPMTWMPYDPDKEFAPGEGFWIKPDGNAVNPKVTISGEVITSVEPTLTKTLQAGSMELVAYPMPGSIVIDDIVLTGALPEGTSWIHWWNRSNYTWTEAVWCDLSDEGDGSVIGWGDPMTWMPYDPVKVFNPGEGFWIKPDGNAVNPTVTFKNPLAPKAE